MIQRTIQRIGRFLFYRQYEIGELILGFLGVVWGLWVLNPFAHTFSLESYNAFTAVFPEWVWGVGVLVFGVVTIIAALCKHRYYFRAVMLLFNVMLWSFIASKFLLGASANTGFPVYAIVAVTSIWLYLRLTIFKNMIDEIDLIRFFKGK